MIQTFTGTLIVEECCDCGMAFGLTAEFRERRLNDHESFSCPAGHRQRFTGPTEAQQERKRRVAAEQDVRWAREQRDAARQLAETERRSANAYKGHLTRIRKRIANGTCPVPGCKRSGFDRVMAHIASQHPDWLHDHPEVTE